MFGILADSLPQMAEMLNLVGDSVTMLANAAKENADAAKDFIVAYKDGAVQWNVNPIATPESWGLEIRWYGILWAIGIYLCYLVQERLYKHDQCPKNWADKMFIYMLVGVIVGARVGHCWFYEWHKAAELGLDPVQFLGMTFDYRNPYIENPLLLFKIWEGGLASHGGAIGLIIAALLLNWRHFHTGIPWIFDRLVIGVAITATLIRLGNLMNSEIYGGPTDLPWAFNFSYYDPHGWAEVARAYAETHDGAVLKGCHPTQIYEMIYCIIAGIVGLVMYLKTKAARRPGLIFGVWLEIVFFTRFVLEFIKNDQEAFEAQHLLNMGQWLSIPFIIWGIYLIVMAYVRPMRPEVPEYVSQPTPAPQANPKKQKK